MVFELKSVVKWWKFYFEIYCWVCIETMLLWIVLIFFISSLLCEHAHLHWLCAFVMCLLDGLRKERKWKAKGKWFRLDMKWKLPTKNDSGEHMVHVWPPWVLTEACLWSADVYRRTDMHHDYLTLHSIITSHGVHFIP